MNYDKLQQDSYRRNMLAGFEPVSDKRDPDYNTTKDEETDDLTELEIDDLLHTDRIHEVPAEIDDISQIVANHRYDVLDVGECVLAYYRAKAKEVAEG